MKREMPSGVYDLASAVLQPLGMHEGEAVHHTNVKKLWDHFRRPSLARWSVLFPLKQSSNPLCLYTHIDVDRDPIVPRLREWIRTGGAAPTYPAADAVDDRPTESVPTALLPMDPDVWPIFLQKDVRFDADHAPMRQASVHASKVMDAYHRSDGRTVPAALAPTDERLRQFRRLLEQNERELTYRQTVECLGWHHVIDDANVVRGITELLLRPQEGRTWYVKRGPHYRWRLDIQKKQCLQRMAMAK